MNGSVRASFGYEKNQPVETWKSEWQNNNYSPAQKKAKKYKSMQEAYNWQHEGFTWIWKVSVGWILEDWLAE